MTIGREPKECYRLDISWYLVITDLGRFEHYMASFINHISGSSVNSPQLVNEDNRPVVLYTVVRNGFFTVVFKQFSTIFCTGKVQKV